MNKTNYFLSLQLKKKTKKKKEYRGKFEEKSRIVEIGNCTENGKL